MTPSLRNLILILELFKNIKPDEDQNLNDLEWRCISLLKIFNYTLQNIRSEIEASPLPSHTDPKFPIPKAGILSRLQPRERDDNYTQSQYEFTVLQSLHVLSVTLFDLVGFFPPPPPTNYTNPSPASVPSISDPCWVPNSIYTHRHPARYKETNNHLDRFWEKIEHDADNKDRWPFKHDLAGHASDLRLHAYKEKSHSKTGSGRCLAIPQNKDNIDRFIIFMDVEHDVYEDFLDTKKGGLVDLVNAHNAYIRTDGNKALGMYEWLHAAQYNKDSIVRLPPTARTQEQDEKHIVIESTLSVLDVASTPTPSLDVYSTLYSQEGITANTSSIDEDMFG